MKGKDTYVGAVSSSRETLYFPREKAPSLYWGEALPWG